MRLSNILGNIGQLPKQPTATKRNEKKIATVREATFVRPLINTEQRNATLVNYLKHIDTYNDAVIKFNEPWKHRNQSVKPVAFEVFKAVARFKRYAADIEDINEYNMAAMEFNAEHGSYIRYKYRQTVKPASRLYFTAILHMYEIQLRERNNINIKANKQYKSKLPRVRVNSYHITTQERAGIRNLDVCSKTVRNHINRLEEAGVLLKREYRGTKAPLTFVINPQIIVAFDAENGKSLTAENQNVTSAKRKELPHIKSTTRYINNNKKKENINNSPERDFASQSLKDLIYKSTKPQVEDNKPQKEKIAQKSSAKILRILDRPQVLAKKLSEGFYNHYAPIKTTELRKLITSPDLTDEDYRELVIQDFIKSSASMWANNQASIGSWYNALVHIYNRYGTTNFKGKAMSRNKMYSWLMEMRYRLSYANNWFKKREWDGIWYPNIYFDPIRKLPTDVCFAYTEKVWSQKMKKQNDAAEKRRKEAAAAKRREEALSKHRIGMRSLDGYIYRYLEHTITLENLTMALTTMPDSVQEKFSERLDTLRTRKMAKDE